MDSNIISNFFIYLIVYRSLIIIVALVSIILGYKLFIKGITESEASLGAETSGFNIKLKNIAPGGLFLIFGVFLICYMLYSGSPQLTLELLDKNNIISSNHINNTDYSLKLDPTLSSKTNPKHIDKKDEQNEMSTTRNSVNTIDKQLQNKETNVETQSKQNTKKSKLTIRTIDESKIRQLIISELNNYYSIQDYTRKAICFDNQGNRNAAHNNMEQALKILSTPINGIAWSYYQKGEYKLAQRLAELAITLSPYEASYLDTQAEILYKQNEFRKAYNLIQRASDIDKSFESKLPRFAGQVN